MGFSLALGCSVNVCQADFTLTGDNFGDPSLDGPTFTSLFIGTAGGAPGTLTINSATTIGNGSVVNVELDLGIGAASFDTNTAGGAGSVTVTDNNSQLIVGGPLQDGGFSVGSNGPNPGTGTLNVFNNGMVIFKDSDNIDSFISFNVGSGGDGTLNINSGGKVQVLDEDQTASDIAIRVGRTSGGIGTMTISGAGSQLLMQGRGPFFDIGREEGTGTVTVENGASLDIIGPSDKGAALYVGRNGGDGTLTVTNASVRVIAENNDGVVRVGREVDSNGLLTISGPNALLEVNDFGIGVQNNLSDGGAGSVVLNGGAQIKAINTTIGTDGALLGNGTINGNVTNNGGLVGADVNTTKALKANGATLTINGDYTQTAGVLEVALDASGVSDVTVTGATLISNGIIRLIILEGFVPSGAPIPLVNGGGTISIDPAVVLEVIGGEDLNVDLTPDGSIKIESATPTPIPTLSQWAMLLLAGLLVLGGIWASRNRRQTAI